MRSIGFDMTSPVLSAPVSAKAAMKQYYPHVAGRAVRRPHAGGGDAGALVRRQHAGGRAYRHAHRGGSAVPLPFYDTAVVAKAAVDALEHHRSDMSVGATGRLLVPLAHLFPSIRGLLTRPIIRTLNDRSPAPTRENNLYVPMRGMLERTASRRRARRASPLPPLATRGSRPARWRQGWPSSSAPRPPCDGRDTPPGIPVSTMFAAVAFRLST